MKRDYFRITGEDLYISVVYFDVFLPATVARWVGRKSFQAHQLAGGVCGNAPGLDGVSIMRSGYGAWCRVNRWTPRLDFRHAPHV